MQVNTIDISSEVGKQKQYYGVDLMKFIGAFFVVIIHVPPLKSVAPFLNYALVNYLVRIAVPFFFVASGYFLFRKTTFDNFDIGIPIKYAVKNIKLYLIWTVIYLYPIIYYTIIHNEKGRTYGIWESIRNTIFMGSYVHLWYVKATAVAVLMLALLVKKRVKLIYIMVLATVLYVIGLLGQSYFGLLRPLESNETLWEILQAVGEVMGTTRNGVFEGFFFILLGALFAYKPIVMRFRNAVIGFCISMILLFGEVVCVKYFDWCIAKDMYIFLVPAVFFLFYIATHVELKEHKRYREMRAIGAMIFYIHLWINVIVARTYEEITGGKEFHSVPNFLLTLLCTVVVAILLVKLSNRKKFKWLRKLY